MGLLGGSVTARSSRPLFPETEEDAEVRETFASRSPIASGPFPIKVEDEATQGEADDEEDEFLQMPFDGDGEEEAKQPILNFNIPGGALCMMDTERGAGTLAAKHPFGGKGFAKQHDDGEEDLDDSSKSWHHVPVGLGPPSEYMEESHGI